MAVSAELEDLIKKWSWEADNDGIPPATTPAQREELAREFARVEKEKDGIKPWPFIGLSEDEFIRAEALRLRSNDLFFFLAETRSLDYGYALPEKTMEYITDVLTKDVTNGKEISSSYLNFFLRIFRPQRQDKSN